MRGLHILVAGSLLGFPRERGHRTTAEPRPERLLETRSAIICRVAQ